MSLCSVIYGIILLREIALPQMRSKRTHLTFLSIYAIAATMELIVLGLKLWTRRRQSQNCIPVHLVFASTRSGLLAVLILNYILKLGFVLRSDLEASRLVNTSVEYGTFRSASPDSVSNRKESPFSFQIIKVCHRSHSLT